MAIVELRKAGKSFGSAPIIQDVDLRIEDGEFAVFAGPSGCGKSTLLRMIAELELVSSREIRLDSQVVNAQDLSGRGVVMGFQRYALYLHMTVGENMGFSLQIANRPKAEIPERVNEASRILQLDALLGRRPSQLSGGQRQRVAIGRAIVRNPKVFLFDEPLSNLDAELRVATRVEIARLHKSLGNTMIHVTHDQTEAMTLADKIVVLRKGRIEQEGPPFALYDNPNNVFVAGFIGSPKMDFIQGRVVEGGKVAFAGVEAQAPFAARAAETGDAVTVGLSPEHFFSAQGAAATMEVAVDLIGHLGGTNFVHGHVRTGEPVIVEHRDAGALKTEMAVMAGFAGTSLLAFDVKDGRLR